VLISNVLYYTSKPARVKIFNHMIFNVKAAFMRSLQALQKPDGIGAKKSIKKGIEYEIGYQGDYNLGLVDRMAEFDLNRLGL
jgi:hypothetical protein